MTCFAKDRLGFLIKFWSPHRCFIRNLPWWSHDLTQLPLLQISFVPLFLFLSGAYFQKYKIRLWLTCSLNNLHSPNFRSWYIVAGIVVGSLTRHLLQTSPQFPHLSWLLAQLCLPNLVYSVLSNISRPSFFDNCTAWQSICNVHLPRQIFQSRKWGCSWRTIFRFLLKVWTTQNKRIREVCDRSTVKILVHKDTREISHSLRQFLMLPFPFVHKVDVVPHQTVPSWNKQ